MPVILLDQGTAYLKAGVESGPINFWKNIGFRCASTKPIYVGDLTSLSPLASGELCPLSYTGPDEVIEAEGRLWNQIGLKLFNCALNQDDMHLLTTMPLLSSLHARQRLMEFCFEVCGIQSLLVASPQFYAAHLLNLDEVACGVIIDLGSSAFTATAHLYGYPLLHSCKRTPTNGFKYQQEALNALKQQGLFEEALRSETKDMLGLEQPLLAQSIIDQTFRHDNNGLIHFDLPGGRSQPYSLSTLMGTISTAWNDIPDAVNACLATLPHELHSIANTNIHLIGGFAQSPLLLPGVLDALRMCYKRSTIQVLDQPCTAAVQGMRRVLARDAGAFYQKSRLSRAQYLECGAEHLVLGFF
ncbi:actin [Giardia muris]|uniref:Actin n=1 Tax=Giardia muris TaxID=5742 RepID=A0A4Z1SNV3_GIAMU|nr:actin [Giardia muris]|eukprot:TNJ27504.1 actin [Giardia muris]